MMKKLRFMCLLIVVSMFLCNFSFLTADATENEVFYGNITMYDGVDEDLDGAYVILWVVNAYEDRESYYLIDKLEINGEKYTDAWAVYDALETTRRLSSFAEFVLEDGKITAVNFSKSSETFEDVPYDAETQTFEGLEDFADLPVFYDYRGRYFPPYLDEEHLYTIELYDYAIKITDMKAADYPETIKLIRCDSYPDKYLSQGIGAWCYMDSREYGINGNFYDENNELVESVWSNWDYIFCEGLPNISATYTAEVWVEDYDGVRISPIYTQTFNAEQFTIYSGRVIASEHYEKRREEYLRLLIDVNGEEMDCKCTENLFIDGKIYDSLTEGINIIPIGARVDFAIEGGTIQKMLMKPFEFKTDGNLKDGKFEIYLDNNTEEKKKGEVYCAVYDKRNMLKHFYIRDLELDKFSDTYEYITAEDISAGDYAKVFVLDDNLSPLTSAEEVDLG